jgi:hypothetical protein
MVHDRIKTRDSILLTYFVEVKPTTAAIKSAMPMSLASPCAQTGQSPQPHHQGRFPTVRRMSPNPKMSTRTSGSVRFIESSLIAFLHRILASLQKCRMRPEGDTNPCPL